MTQEQIDRQEIARELRFARLRFEDAMDALRALLVYGLEDDGGALAAAIAEARAVGRVTGALYREISDHGLSGFDATGDVDVLRNAILEYRTNLAVAFSDVRVETTR
jgi:hypothetical protein